MSSPQPESSNLPSRRKIDDETPSSPSPPMAGSGELGEASAGEEGEIPMTMSASVVLTSLPKDARSALREAGVKEGEGEMKITVHFRPVPGAPSMPPRRVKSKIAASKPFSAVQNYLRKWAAVKTGDSIFCYLHTCWSPGLDEPVGGLFDCFKTGEELVISYAVHPAFG